ncbi:TetR/AcrR family transcriptional regulator C-terminal domain-containing protein [Leptospira idonii]|uniref:TetR family transcriptional regulator n=1 Tax=Leptospira idonii TaxID=1193500 RepID=A0A4R9LV58_9LEPT|nr:TetR/AcrR family transcriptional regulator C-terminal domain-containing protein [Leptospira idonii]TGN18051.1 TetR family transcriptional regulator [Leptospira idonii]
MEQKKDKKAGAKSKPKNTKEISGKKKQLTKEKMIDAAILLADEKGIDSLSMRNLAQSLGVEAMSLYNHIKNKDELLDEIVDSIVAKIKLPLTGIHWMSAMEERAKSARIVLLQHPWVTLLIVSRVNVGSAMLTYFDASLGCLAAAGFSLPLADHAINAIDSHIYGYTLQELNFPIQPEEYAMQAEAFMPMLDDTIFPHLTGLAKEVISRRYDGMHDFEFGLKIILEGLEKLRINTKKGK